MKASPTTPTTIFTPKRNNTPLPPGSSYPQNAFGKSLSTSFEALKADEFKKSAAFPSQTPQSSEAHSLNSLKSLKASALLFGAKPLYQGPFDNIKIITDYGVGQTEEIANHEIKDRIDRVLAHTQKTLQGERKSGTEPQFQVAEWAKTPASPTQTPGFLEISSISDLPGGNTDLVSLGLLRLGGSEPNQNIFIHVVDPGVGVTDASAHDRSILVSKDHGIYIGPNNGSLALIAQRLEHEKDPFSLFQIDLQKVTAFEQDRLKNKTYRLPETIHGRDVFAVVAGAIAGGFTPESFAEVLPGTQKPKELSVVRTPYSQPTQLPNNPGEVKKILALRDKTFGNLKLNIPLTPEDFDALQLEKTIFQVRSITKEGASPTPWIDVPVGKKFSDQPIGNMILYHGSSSGVIPGTRNLEIAIHLGYAGESLNVPLEKPKPIEIRVKPR
ncbi:MAG: SAM-dependent chlorinase/fluorinase [Cyanobacteria bacterium]|nr:SAM-dependent chlorinase/fluorinase [Cyanobacteriota bacterium]